MSFGALCREYAGGSQLAHVSGCGWCGQREEIALENRTALEKQIKERKAREIAAKRAEEETATQLKQKAELHEKELQRQREAEHLQRMAYRRVLDKQRE